MNWSISVLPISGFAANCYWLENGRNAWIIDPAAYPEKKPHTDAVLQGIIVTHGHMDHILTADYWRDKFQVPLYIHEKDAHMLTDSRGNVSATFGLPQTWRAAEKTVVDEDKIELGDGSWLDVISTPGHTSGGICLMLNESNGKQSALFTGDTVFSDSVGRTDLGGSDLELNQSLRKIKRLMNKENQKMLIYPGHGPSISFIDLCFKNPWVSRIS